MQTQHILIYPMSFVNNVMIMSKSLSQCRNIRIDDKIVFICFWKSLHWATAYIAHAGNLSFNVWFHINVQISKACPSIYEKCHLVTAINVVDH